MPEVQCLLVKLQEFVRWIDPDVKVNDQLVLLEHAKPDCPSRNSRALELEEAVLQINESSSGHAPEIK
jgi:hypothetical protein